MAGLVGRKDNGLLQNQKTCNEINTHEVADFKTAKSIVAHRTFPYHMLEHACTLALSHLYNILLLELFCLTKMA